MKEIPLSPSTVRALSSLYAGAAGAKLAADAALARAEALRADLATRIAAHLEAQGVEPAHYAEYQLDLDAGVLRHQEPPDAA